jgi:hypothetical protein
MQRIILVEIKTFSRRFYRKAKFLRKSLCDRSDIVQEAQHPEDSKVRSLLDG